MFIQTLLKPTGPSPLGGSMCESAHNADENHGIQCWRSQLPSADRVLVLSTKATLLEVRVFSRVSLLL